MVFVSKFLSVGRQDTTEKGVWKEDGKGGDQRNTKKNLRKSW